jgi:AsmA family protein
MRLVLKILGGMAALLLVLLIGIVVAIYTIDVDTLIAPVKDRVRAATGRELSVRGGASIALSLQPRLVLKDVALSNAPWGKAPQMLSAQRLELQVALVPLLSRRFELIELALVGPVVALETDAKGAGNWEFAAAPSAGAPTPAGARGPGAAAAFGVANLMATDGTLTYRDGKTGNVKQVTIESLSVRARDRTEPIATQFRGKIDGVAVSLAGTLGPPAALLERRWPYPFSLKGEIAGRPTEVSAKLRADGAVYALEGLDLKFGTYAVTGDFRVDQSGARPKVIFALRAPALALADLPLAPPPAAAVITKASTAPDRGIFPDAPIDFAFLRAIDADGSLDIGRLAMAPGRTLENLRVAGALSAGRLDVPTLSATSAGGALTGSIRIDAGKAGSESLSVRLTGRNFMLGPILAALGHPREVRGGASEFDVNLAMRGSSPHAWASTATGGAKVVVGPATLVNTQIDLNGPLAKLLNAVNPLRTVDESTELTCAVIRLPFDNGIARVDRSIAIETRQLDVTASGMLDLRNETLDFSFTPRVRKGLPIKIPNLAQLVRWAGPITAPEVKIDAVASAQAIASIGAAVSTGGLSAIGQALFAQVQSGGADVCQVALGTASPTQPAAAQQPAARAPAEAAPARIVDDVGKAIGRLFGK